MIYKIKICFSTIIILLFQHVDYNKSERITVQLRIDNVAIYIFLQKNLLRISGNRVTELVVSGTQCTFENPY